MKRLKRPVRKEKRSTRSGATRHPNRLRDRDGNSSIRRRRHPKTELEAAIQRFVDLYDFAPIAYVSFDRAGRIEEANLVATELLGEPRDRLIGRPFAFYVGDLDLFLRHLLYCRTSQQQVETELELKPRKGVRIPALLCSRPITSTTRNGALLYQTAIMDLSERKRAEEALRAKEAELEAVINRTPFMLTRCSRDLRYRFVSQAYADMLGRAPDEIAGKPIVEIMGEEGLKTISPHIEKVLKGQHAEYETEVSFRGVGAPCLRCVYTPDRDSNGNVIGWFASIVDVTEWKRAEYRLAVNLAVTKILAESPALSDAVPRILQTICETLGWELGDFWTLEPKAKVLRCLEIWECRAGSLPKFKAICRERTFALGIGLPGRVWSSLKPAWVPDVTKDNNFPRASIAASEGLHGGFAFPIFFRKHFLAVMEFFSREIREPDEELLRMFASIGSQIGQFMERKRAEEALQQSKELLEVRVREGTRELRVANTELRNEIERRKGLEGEILAVSDREQQRLGQELHDGVCQHLTAVAFMARSVALRLKNHRVIDVTDIEKIAQLVNDAAGDMRNLSRALHRSDVDAPRLTGALQDLVDREVWRVSCRLEVKPSFQIEDDMVAAQLYRIAREAVINANKHSHAREIVVRLERSRGGMVLHVTDDGVGFLNGTEPRQGLGFHIMNYRAQVMGGRLEIESPKRGGTRVSCYLPNKALQSRKKENAGSGLPGKIANALAALI